MKHTTPFILFLVVIPVFFSCKGGKPGKELDMPTRGTITVATDESIKPLLEAEVDVFQSLYPDAHINANYTNEYDAIKQLLDDSARMAIITRKLTADEENVLKSQGYQAHYTTIAWDGIAFILNNENKDTIYSLDSLKQILLGSIDHIAGKGTKPGEVVFDNARSGAIKYLRDSLLNGMPLGKNCFAVNSNPEVIEYVKNHKNAIGIIGSSWISDTDDTLSLSFLKTIQVARIIPHHPETAESRSMKPYQAYIALKQYPLYRNIIIVSREARAGLGTGFTSFIAGDPGQRIILKSGIVPANAPVRLVNVK